MADRERRESENGFPMTTPRHVVTERLDSPWPNAPVGKYWMRDYWVTLPM